MYLFFYLFCFIFIIIDCLLREATHILIPTFLSLVRGDSSKNIQGKKSYKCAYTLNENKLGCILSIAVVYRVTRPPRNVCKQNGATLKLHTNDSAKSHRATLKF